jgi:hypothetical protein
VASGLENGVERLKGAQVSRKYKWGAALLPNETLKAAENTHLKALEGEAPTIPSSDGAH